MLRRSDHSEAGHPKNLNFSALCGNQTDHDCNIALITAHSGVDYAIKDSWPPTAELRGIIVSNERLYPKLSREQRDRTVRELRNLTEEGCCSPKLQPSLLGLDWSCFVTRKFSEHPDTVSFWNPPEFISYGFSTLDAYATAVLAAHFSFRLLGVLAFSCNLKRRAPESAMYLEFTVTPEQGRINPDAIMVELLRSFPELLYARDIEANAWLFLEGEGCAMEFDYPGHMVADASPFLRDRPVDLWPQVTLCLTPTDELRIRAQKILRFLRSSMPTDVNPT